MQAIFTVVLGKAALVGEYQGELVERVAPSWGSLPSSWNYGKRGVTDYLEVKVQKSVTLVEPDLNLTT